MKNEKEFNHEKNGKKNILNKFKIKNLIHFNKNNFNKFNYSNKNFFELIIIIIVNIIIKSLSEEIKIRKLESISEIIMKINGKGYQNILNKNFLNLPDEVIINNINQTKNARSLYNLTNETNVIILKWYNPISSGKEMFKYLTNISFINLSNFNTNNISDMTKMFYNCSSLTSIDFGNINTSSVTSMEELFYNCTSIQSLDLSNFNTLNVNNMKRMFEKC